jgi:hypothetical protein
VLDADAAGVFVAVIVGVGVLQFKIIVTPVINSLLVTSVSIGSLSNESTYISKGP